jgi:competence CoiA-like predicted nuclease
MSTRRTIEAVFETSSGKEITANNFFSKSFDQIIQARAEQERANQGHGGKWLTCYVCGADIRILGGKESRIRDKAQNFHFAHLHKSADCPIKTHSKLSREDINRLRYRGINEGIPHIELKEKLYRGLLLNEQNKGQISDLQLERIIRNLEESEWKKPDINAYFQGKRVAFELQLSTTWLDVIIKRQSFYHAEGIFILWIFNQFDSQDNSRKLAYSDIFYTNNYNAFVLDQEALAATIKKKDLVLNCHYQFFYTYDGKVHSRLSNELVTLDQLTFDKDSVTIYYKNVAAEKAEAERAAKQYLRLEEQSKKEEREKRDKLFAMRDELQSEYDIKKVNSEEIIQCIREEDHFLNQYHDKLKKLTYKLAGANTEAEDAYKTMVSAPHWGYPELVREMMNKFENDYKVLSLRKNEFYTALKALEEKQKNYQSLKTKNLNNITYHILDKEKHWSYISTNTDRLFSFHSQQGTDLFSRPSIEPLSLHQLNQMRFNKAVEILADFNYDVKENNYQIEIHEKSISELTLSMEAMQAQVIGTVKSILNAHYHKELDQVRTKIFEQDEILNALRATNQSQTDELEELVEKIAEYDHLDFEEDK